MSFKRGLPPPLPGRRATGINGQHLNGVADKAGSDLHINWSNLSPEDKEALFSWLDEFFAVYFQRLSDPRAQLLKPTPPPNTSTVESSLTPVNPRPPLPVRRSTTEAAPTTKSSFVTQAPPLPVRRPDLSLQHHAESEPAPTTKNPPKPPQRTLPPRFKPSEDQPPAAPRINLSTKPAAPIIEVASPVAAIDECMRCRDYTAVDQHASSFPRESVDTIHQLAHDLTSPFPHQFDKLRSITFWLHLNISYDAYSFLNNCVKPSTPDSTLRSGMAVCEGYAGLFAALALASGIECIVISGHGKGYGYSPPLAGQPLPPYSAGHAWNAVHLSEFDGSWKLIDSCWAGGALDHSGVFQRRFDAFHFVASNEEFGKRHFPDPSEPWKQFVDPLVSWEEYIGAVDDLPTMTSDFGDGQYASHLLYPQTRVIPPGPTTFYLKQKCEHWSESEEDTYVHVMMGAKSAMDSAPGRAGWKAMSPDTVNGGWRFDDLRVERGDKVMIAIVKTVGEQNAIGMGKREYDKICGRKAMQFSVLCQWEVQ